MPTEAPANAASEAEARARPGTRHPAASPPPERPVVGDDEDREPLEGRELIEAAARDGKLSDEEQVDALEWFLSDTDELDQTYSFEINVGTPTHKRWATWTIKPVDMDRLRAIRRQSQGNRRQRRAGGGELDEVAANVQIVLEGTVKPDLRDAAQQIGLVDPGAALRTRFQHKPGLLAQIAGEVMSLSGYDDEDVREVDAARG